MSTLQQLKIKYGIVDCRDLTSNQLKELRDELKIVTPDEVTSSADGKAYIELLRKFREAVAENDKLHGDNYPALLSSILSVGEDGLYSNSLRFIFELIQNVDDCEYHSPDDCSLDMYFDFNLDKIVLTYNEVGFTPFNVFAITGIAEAAKNVTSSGNEIGEKGIGFKSVFGVSDKVLIRSGWFSFELYKENFTIPVASYQNTDYCPGTEMTLYVPERAKQIYREIKAQYCSKEALFSRNPLLFLNKLTSLKMYFDVWRSMEYHVSRSGISGQSGIEVERDVEISVNLRDHDDNGSDVDVRESIICSRYSYPVVFTRKACQARYGEDTQVGLPNGKTMILRVVLPNPEYIQDVGMGALYSFLPTQLKLTVPMVCHVPFKLDASREFVDPQGENLWFQEASQHLAKLIDYAYMDWRSIVKENIVHYIPGIRKNLFAENNGKEKCLSKQRSFSGAYYLNFPLFFCSDRAYHKAVEVFCFNMEEDITDPEKVYRLMGYLKYLFLSPISVNQFDIHTERNVNDQLLNRAFSAPAYTAEILDYLDHAEYVYAEERIKKQVGLSLGTKQLEEIFRHPNLAGLLQTIGCNQVKGNGSLTFYVTEGISQELQDILYKDFDLDETPRNVEKYMTYCHKKCICLDIKEDCFLPCKNAIVLSKNNPLASFASFCYAIDKRSTFAIRLKLREASERLNQYVEEEVGSASDYLRDLRNIRLLIKESLGSRGYSNYINLILNSGTERGRFVQEILQNADDCEYSSEVLPTFVLNQKENIIQTEYNEVGFNRANIRAITAIGESTKNRLFNEDLKTIGEKGVGFKTIFAVASEVKIRSGAYAFSLTDREPTIPRILKSSEQSNKTGTRMEILLNDKKAFPTMNNRSILELCLCLRKLRSIQIGDHTVLIEDTDGQRCITIDKRRYVFKRFTHSFTITDERALKERRNSARAISPEQTITCFVPETGTSEYPLYNGLPTRHKIKIPMAIDAPFALTTSREEIETDSSSWNNIIRRELYTAIMKVIHTLKYEEREKVLRFVRFVPRFKGSVRVYVNDISDSSFLAEYDYLSKLKASKILPTLDRDVFEMPKNKAAYRFPEVSTILFEKVTPSEYAGIRPSTVIDVTGKDYEAALNALECEAASFAQAFGIVKKHAEHYIRDEKFRASLYVFLENSDSHFREQIKSLAIIPVYGKTFGRIEFISWKDDSIFVRKETSVSGADYFVLNEKILSKASCEKIIGSNINEMNYEWERNRYNKRLKEILNGNDITRIYYYLLNEFHSGALRKNESFAILNAVPDKLPMKNELGEIAYTKLFICNEPTGYFPVKMIQRLIVHKECQDFAKYMKLSELCHIHYNEIGYKEFLTADDVECLLDDYFENAEEILRGFYKEGLLPDELLEEYGLEFISVGRAGGEHYVFPMDPVIDRNSLINHVKRLLISPARIVSVKVERTVQKGQAKDGTRFELNVKDTREGALRTYMPEGTHNQCFCQMCHQVKPYRLIEVNNIEILPKYYFPQLRIALCLECSKRFEYLRNNSAIRKKYLNDIKNFNIQNQGTVDIDIGREDKITFTGKHLAEIQEILRRMPN